jgi:hypothetical protein
MVKDVFQQADEPMALSKRAAKIVEEALQVADGLHEEFNKGGHNNEGDVPPMFGGDHEPLRERSFEDESQEASLTLWHWKMQSKNYMLAPNVRNRQQKLVL